MSLSILLRFAAHDVHFINVQVWRTAREYPACAAHTTSRPACRIPCAIRKADQRFSLFLASLSKFIPYAYQNSSVQRRCANDHVPRIIEPSWAKCFPKKFLRT